jgi:hypothetical protein
MRSNAAYVIHEDDNLITLAPAPATPAGSTTDFFETAVPAPAPGGVLLHMRSWPNAVIREIAECPSTLTKEEWFTQLCARFGDKYETRAGGRGFFRISAAELESLKAENAR